MHIPHRRLRRATVVIAAGALALISGCGQPARPDPVRRLAACVSPTAERPTDGRVTLEFRQGDTVVASGSVPVGSVFEASVPAGADVEVYADGQHLGGSGSSQAVKVGDNGATYIAGPGCPESPTG